MIEIKLFKASWCGQCHIMEDTLRKLETEYPDIKFSYHDVDNEEILTKKFDIMSLPTTIILKDGNQLTQIHGMKTKVEFIKSLKEVL